MNLIVQEIIEKISKVKFKNLTNEKKLQYELMEVLSSFNISKEFYLTKKDIIDFVIEKDNINIGIEIKIKGSPREIYRQIERYSKNDYLSCILLISNKSMGLPTSINEKPLYFYNIGRNWL